MNQSINLTVYNFHLTLVFVSLHGLSCGVEIYMQVQIQAPPPPQKRKEKKGNEKEREERKSVHQERTAANPRGNSSNVFF